MTTTERATETLDTTWVYSTGQYWTSETILRHRSGATVRLRVRRDFYPHQSTATAEMWTPTGWTPILSRDPAAFSWASEAPSPAPGNDSAARRYARRIHEDLLRVADAVLDTPPPPRPVEHTPNTHPA
jgi:hypothetical protein